MGAFSGGWRKVRLSPLLRQYHLGCVINDELALLRDEDAFVSDSGCVDFANDVGCPHGQGIRMMSTGFSSGHSRQRIVWLVPGTNVPARAGSESMAEL
jgi:hypothetical protein